MFELRKTTFHSDKWEDAKIIVPMAKDAKELNKLIFQIATEAQEIERPCVRYWIDEKDGTTVYDVGTSCYIKVKEIQ